MAAAASTQPADTPKVAAPGRGSGDSAFDTSSFERSLARHGATRWIGWRRRALVLATVLGCLGVLSLARWLATTPQIDARFGVGADGALVLASSPIPQLDDNRGLALTAISAPGQAPMPVDALLLHRSPRWQMDDAARGRQLAQQVQLAALLARGAVQLHFSDGTALVTGPVARGYAGVGLLFWPLAGVALLLCLFAAVVMLARPRPRNLLFVTMALCQAANLLLIAMENLQGPGLPGGIVIGDMPLRVALDLCTVAAAVHAFALHPLRLRHANAIAGAAWAGVVGWLLVAQLAPPTSLWWWTQTLCTAYGVAALAVIHHSHRTEPNPYALIMRRFAAVTLATCILATTAVAVAARLAPHAASGVAQAASVAWYLFFSSLLLLTPFLSRSRQLLREFAMLAGISTVATSLDLLFAAVFSVGPFTSLAVAVFVALGLYAGARQWLMNRMLGRSLLTTERAFDQIYRAARDVQARPSHHPQRMAQLLRDLFEPLEVMRVDRVPLHARLVGGGAAMVVPMTHAEDDTTAAASPASAALVLRFAQRGQRLFTLEDARLADRVVDQLGRAVAYDQAVERGRTEERVRIAQDLHDDIGARLLTLMYQAQSPEMEDYIRHTLQDLKTLTRGLAAAEHRLSHAAAEWKADMTQRLTVSHVGLDWSFEFDRDVRLSVVQWSALTRVLRELVSNALYHGHASRISVAFRLHAGLLTLQVADDGRGREPQAWAHGLGMGGVRKRVKALGGDVAWNENMPRGIVCAMRVAGFGRPA